MSPNQKQPKTQREQRLAQALKANLKRRKAAVAPAKPAEKK